MIKKLKNIFSKQTAIFVFLVSIAIYSSNIYSDYQRDFKSKSYRNLLTSSDNVPSTFLPFVLYKTGSFDFSSITFYLRQFHGGEKKQYFIFDTGTQKVSVYPVFPGIAAFPIYFPFLALNKISSFDFYENILKILLLGRVTGIIFSSITVVVFFLILKSISTNLKTNILFTIFFAFGTTMWSISSRGVWSHTFTALLVSLIIYILLNKKINYKITTLVGFLGGLTILNRPTGAVISGIIGLYIIYKSITEKEKKVETLKKALFYFLGNLPSIIFNLTYNTLIFGGPFNEGYAARNDLKWTTPFFEGIFGNLLMPGKGLIAITPVFILSFIFLYKVSKNKNYSTNNTLYRFLGIIFLIFLGFYSKWYAWWGGNTAGYRFFTDLTPILGLFAFELYREIVKNKIKIIVLILVIYSIFMQGSSVYYQKSRCEDEDMHRLGCIDFSAIENVIK